MPEPENSVRHRSKIILAYKLAAPDAIKLTGLSVRCPRISSHTDYFSKLCFQASESECEPWISKYVLSQALQLELRLKTVSPGRFLYDPMILEQHHRETQHPGTLQFESTVATSNDFNTAHALWYSSTET
mmetsp:Transcript_23610/g.37651  ORF Transcript_23610/g.37651 Transcript_23610/m.37651 type:complete len:130 (+) Transcript_23610:347-736(+)